MGFPPRLRVSASSDPATCHQQDSSVIRLIHPSDSLLADAKMVSDDRGSSSERSEAAAKETAGDRLENDATAVGATPISLMEDFQRLHGVNFSEAAFRLLQDGWRESSRERYAKAWGGKNYIM